ncbi:alpha/beta fold hydrolase [Solimicrobium silvestre]|uniref:Alpha/beta hydrolase family n=1 Tax=Solimicrobium silvestre TaxID=2099400 RepID=A0A2S9GX46_9BURK|nr:alpha/beta hydrolase [Solimicrobium silvestre]PRC92293.1 Alpha/beta hydrolase family [Solimicrobium silvestre]
MIRRSDQVRIESVQCISPDGLHRMAYKEWGEVDNPNVLLCVHGVTRVSDDFDALARELSSQFRVICPDVVGRGRSGWLRNPQHYQVQQYVCDMVTLLARINPPNLSFLGTSMGGLIGIGLASLPENPIQKLILNDIGPVLNISALTRIAQYIGQPMRFATFDEAAQFIRTISQTFGEHTEEEWHKFCMDVLRQDKDGMWIRHYDLKLAVSMQAVSPELAEAMQMMMWAAYDAIACPTLLLRGAESDLLLPETALQMTKRGPRAQLVEFEKVGHAPTLVHADQITVIKDFLLE